MTYLSQATAVADRYFVPHWRLVTHFFSVRALALQTAMLVAWAQMPDDLKNALPHWLLPAIGGFVLFVGTLGAMFNQKDLHHDRTDDPSQPRD